MTVCKRNCSDSSKSEQSKRIKTIRPMEAHPDLPEEIIVQIVRVLPVKSLLRFRCVCKSWLSLISSSEFIKTHLKYSINNADLINHQIMFTIINPKNNLNLCSARFLMFEPLTVASEIDYPWKNPHMSLTVASEIDYPWKNPHMSLWVVGSCNGLICIYIYRKGVFLWNPSMRTSKKLPSPAIKLKPSFHCMYGFGCNEYDDDYKVVGIFSDFGNEGVHKSVVKVYSLRTDSWKRIGDFESDVLLDDSSKFTGGKFHFIVGSEIYSSYELAIVSLDLNSEIYGKVELPNYEKGFSDILLGVLGGCLCVTLNYRQIRADVWVLKEYDVKESWTKMVSIPYTLQIGFESRHGYSNPLLMLPSGEILLVFVGCLVIYNPKDNSFRRPSTSNIDHFLQTDIYVESLVSL